MKCDVCDLEKQDSDFVANRGKKVRRCRLCALANCKITQRKYYKDNASLVKDRTTKSQAQRISEWATYFQSKYGDPFCECCNKALRWAGQDKKSESVHFDHRRGNEVINTSPTKWIRCRRATPTNIAVFESCNFGILCDDCNRCLPTHNRMQWLKKAMTYAKNTETSFTN